MKKTSVIKFFGSRAATADELDITKQAVNYWGPIVPRGIAFEVHFISKGQVPIDREFYRRQRRRAKGMKSKRTRNRSVAPRPSA